MAGVIAMAAALVVVAIESYLTTRGAGHAHHHTWEGDDPGGPSGDAFTPKTLDPAIMLHHSPQTGLAAARGGASPRPPSIIVESPETEGLVSGRSPLPSSTPPSGLPPRGFPQAGLLGATAKGSDHDRWDSGADEDDLDEDLELDMDELDHPEARSIPRRGPLGQQYIQLGSPAPPRSSVHLYDSRHAPSQTTEEQKRALIQCLLLEAGILFHSVFIGMALSVASGPAFAVFLVAIAFHQSFEGLALGSRIAAIAFPRSSPRPWLMVLAYGTTTPLGQAIGLAVHNMYDPQSQAGLLMVGVMNAVSSGLLLFAGLVQLLAEDFLTEKSYATLHGTRRVHAFLAVLAGAALMAMVGAFA